MSIRRWRRIQALAWAMLTTIALLAPGDPDPSFPAWLPKALKPVADKLVHAALFFVLALLTDRASRQEGHERAELGPVLVAVGLLAVILEIGQIWVPNRTFEIPDMLAGLAGVVAAALLLVAKNR